MTPHQDERLVDDPRDREEICQNAFIRVVHSIASYRAEAKLVTWIGRIAYRESLQHLRRRRMPPAGAAGDAAGDPDPDELHATAPGPLAETERRELEAFVAAAVGRLSVEQKAAVTLFYLEGMSVAEVAQVMGLPENTVKSHLSRARQRLRSLLIAEARDHGYTS